MTNVAHRPVVVGIDHSAASQRALRFAIDEAALHGSALRVVHAYDWIRHTAPPAGAFPISRSPHPESSWEPVLTAAVELARLQLGTDRVSGLQALGQAIEVLLDQSADARLLVVGTRGHHAPASVLIGSVAAGLIAECPCPVTVTLPTAPNSANGIVVGVDGSPGAEHAVGYAFQEAALRGLRLTAVHCRDSGGRTTPPQEQSRWLAENIAGYAEKYPDVAVIRTVVAGRPARTLAAQSRGAHLLVVGSRGRGGRTGLVLGSVSQHLLHSALSPMTVVKNSS